MKYHEPRFIALINALTVTVAYLVLFVITSLLAFEHAFRSGMAFLLLVVTSAAIYIITYAISRFTTERYVYSKIRLVYKQIHSAKSGKSAHEKDQPGTDLLEAVDREVEAWKADRSAEIENLKRMEQYRREFIGNVSHELKTPLFNIQGYVLTLLDGGMEDPAINRQYLKRTEKSVERLIRIAEDLDEIARLESGEIQLKITRFDIALLTHEVIEMLEMRAEKAGNRITVMEPEKPFIVEGDKEKIRQVLTNIVGNAIRYGRPGKGKTKITFFDLCDTVLTEITDNGIGIDQEDIPRVFERFYRTQRGREASKKGKGLGLAIVKHIIEAHGQTINLRSTVGIGTTFGFTLKKAGQAS